MAKLTEAMKEVLAGAQAWVATVGADGKPNLAIKGSVTIVDDESLAYFEMVGGKTWVTVQKNPWVALAVAKPEKMKGFRFEGKAEIITTGSLYEDAKKLGEMMKLPAPPKAAIKIKIEEVYDLGNGGQKVT
jgi:predicted pyridoxine 5'-phosphate oxidase superfamily flavin-nucleotide-binding protein